MEFFTKTGLVWWMGVVEDRFDPLKLGRCKVRIFGYHTEDTSILKTEDLPWAVVMQPITSAAISGKGSSPVGILEGTWVVGWFLDGEEKQQPLIVGTFAGKPKTPIFGNIQKNSTVLQGNFVRDSSGNIVYDNSGNPILSGTATTTDTIVTSTLPPLDVDMIKKLTAAIGTKESSNNYNAENSFGYIGKYQFGAAALIDLGYVKAGSTNRDLTNPNSWTGKDGMTSNTAFLGSTTVQESAMFNYLQINYNRLLKTDKITTNDDPDKVAGLLASAHLVGSRNADKFDKKDGNGVRAATYYTLGSTAIGGDGEVPVDSVDSNNRETYLPENPNNPTNDPTKSLNHPALAKSKGFTDPNKVYPTREYMNIGDINKLAIGDNTHSSVKNKNNNRTTNIPVSEGGTPWNQPVAAFAARYPYNQVHETEAGHVVELDSTPGNERIHVYHKNGSFVEIDVNGNSVRKTTGSDYVIIDKNSYVYTKGGYNVTVDGAYRLLVRDNTIIQIEGDATIIGNGNMNIKAAKNVGVAAKNAIVTGKESVGIISDGDVNIQGRNIFLKATGNMNLDAGASFSALGRISAALHGAIVKIKMGAEKLSQLGVILPPSDSKSPDRSVISDRTDTPLPQDENSYLYDTAQVQSTDWAASRSSSGETNPVVPREGNVESNANVTVSSTVVDCDCEEFKNYTSFPDTIKLSKHFTLGALTNRTAASSYTLQDFNGLSKAAIACNLKYLAVNALDKIKDKYPGMIITSGFRTKDGVSDHSRGFAVDMQIPSISFGEYQNVVTWIRNNVPYSQLLLEYEQRSSGTISWIHLSLYKDSAKHALPTATLLNHVVYARNEFVNLA